MADYEDTIHDYFKGCSRGYVTDENFKEVCRKQAEILRQLDGSSSCSQQVDPTHDRIREAGALVAASTKTWHKLGHSVTPKAHIFEDQAIDSMKALSGLGDKTEDFIEFSHQDGACQDIHTQGLREYNHKHESQHKADH